MRFKSLLIVIPTYNEASNIGPLIREIHAHVPEANILVVDDNSPDGTFKRVRELSALDPRIHLLHREKKEGLALAYGAGFKWAGDRFEVLVQMDADFSHRPCDLHKLLEALGDADVALGCRYMPGGGVKNWAWSRRLISRFGTLYARVLLRLPLRDITGGFNAWKVETLSSLEHHTIRSRGYAYLVELKWRAFQSGYRLKEVPILFEERREGVSKISTAILAEAAIRVWQLRGKRFEPQPPPPKRHSA